MLSAGVLLLVAVLPLRGCADVDSYSDCFKSYSVLEQAVQEVGDNHYNIIKAFYSPTSTSPSVYVKVK